jgi:hypothetical protein
MKFIIFRDQLVDNTAMLYLNHNINQCPDHECKILNHTAPIYEVMDTERPDVVVASLESFPEHLMVYLSQNKVNLITYSGSKNSSMVDKFAQILKDENIDVSFFFGPLEEKSVKAKYIRLNHANDVGMQMPPMNFKHPKAVIVGANTDVESIRDIYENDYVHIINMNPKANMQVLKPDINNHIQMIAGLLHCYEEVIYANMADFSEQILFESLVRANKTYVIYNNEAQKESHRKVFGDFDLDYSSKDKIKDFTEIKKVVQEKHNSIKRTKSFLSQVPKK